MVEISLLAHLSSTRNTAAPQYCSLTQCSAVHSPSVDVFSPESPFWGGNEISTPHRTLPAPPHTLHTSLRCALHTAHCTPHTAHCTLHTSYCRKYGLMHIAHSAVRHCIGLLLELGTLCVLDLNDQLDIVDVGFPALECGWNCLRCQLFICFVHCALCNVSHCHVTQ